MIPKALFFPAIAILAGACSSSKKAAAPVVTRTPTDYIQNISVDGNASDWQNVTLATDPDNNIQYALANNNTNLYVLIKIQDRIQQMKLLRGGMELWIDATGKKSKTTGIVYPVKGELNMETRPPVNNGQKPDMKEFRKQIASQLISLNRVGFKPGYTGVQSIYENTGFKAAINWDENDILVYELAIPLAAFKDDVSKDNLDVAFELNGVDRPKENEERSHSSTGYSGGGSRMGGGRMGGYGGGGRGYGGHGGMRSGGAGSGTGTRPIQKMYESESFWTAYTMAKK